MSKYIPADILIAEIKGIIAAVQTKNHPDVLGTMEQCLAAAEIEAFNLVLDAIKELKQERPMPNSTQLIELWFAEKEALKEKDFRGDPWRLAYNAFMRGFGRGIAVNKQEQPEVDLEKLLNLELPDMTIDEDLGLCTCNQFGNQSMTVSDIKEIARHFYKLGLNARKEE